MWNIHLNDDETMIADSVREFLSSELPIERLRPNGAPVDQAKVRSEIHQLGWIGIGLPESVGGSGLGLVEEMLIQREYGRYLVSPSLMATVLAAHVAIHAGEAELARELIAGTTSAALAIAASPEAPADPCAAYALDWNGSELLLFWNEEGMGLFDASAFAGAVVAECLDDSLTMHCGNLVLHRPRGWVSAKAQPLALRAQVLLSAGLVGLAGHACDLAVEYAKVREQFGKQIGSFQAVKHRCADMGLRSRLSWYQTSLACLKVQHGAADAPLHVASAKLVAARAAHENGRAGIQIHGGMGFQSECDAHWFMKRAHVYDQAGGAMRLQSKRVMSQPSPLW